MYRIFILGNENGRLVQATKG
uniref:Uncharacterized protein n=1 Tax=Vitis vinifera TaxID=29760 RepID=F6H7A5_VITVI